MKSPNKYTAIVKQEDDWFIGWIEEIPGANAQEKTKSELMESLREAAKDILEINRQDAKKQAKNDYEEMPIFV